MSRIPFACFPSMSHFFPFFLLCLPFLVNESLANGVPIVADANIYKTVDENGHVIYTDNPKDKKTEPVDLPPVNTQPPQPVVTQRKVANAKTAAPENYSIAIDNPADQTQVPPGQRDVVVGTRISPPLFTTHKIQILVDGQPYQTTRSTQVVLEEVYRGTHQIQARVVDGNGNTLGSSVPVTIYVHRTSVLN